MHVHNFISDRDGNLVNPTFKSCSSGGYTSVTIASSVGRGPNVPCVYCRLQSRSGNGTVNVKIGSVCGSGEGLVLADSPVVVPYAVSNLNLLYFQGTDSNIVDIEYFV
jgi:hypothetical protein